MNATIFSILISLFLTACNSVPTETPQQIVARCNTVTTNEKTDPGLRCYRSEKSLPTAVQFGDSVSKGYGIAARHDLCGVVDYRHDNWIAGDVNVCGESSTPYSSGLIIDAGNNDGYSTTLLQDMEDQLAGKHYNIVLFNSGYHDIQNGIQLSAYRNNLEAIAQTCEQSADICIWVDTPGLDSASLPLEGTTIDAGSVAQYNATAHEVAREHGFYMLAMPDTNHDGTVHFTSEGYDAAGSVVAACVLTALSQQRTETCHQ